MTCPPRRIYSDTERREIVKQARETAQLLLEKIELLARLDDQDEGVVADERHDTS